MVKKPLTTNDYINHTADWACKLRCKILRIDEWGASGETIESEAERKTQKRLPEFCRTANKHYNKGRKSCS